MCDLVDKEYTCFEVAVQKKEWVEAMMEEYQSIMKNDVWEVVPKLEGKSVVSSKWIYKIKHSANGSIDLQSQICGLWIQSKRRNRL